MAASILLSRHRHRIVGWAVRSKMLHEEPRTHPSSPCLAWFKGEVVRSEVGWGSSMSLSEARIKPNHEWGMGGAIKIDYSPG